MSIIDMSKEDREKASLEGKRRFEELVIKFKSDVKGTHFSFFKRIPERYKRNWLKSFYGQSSSKKAIAAKCYECAGYEDTQNNIGQCAARTCPLWSYRPIKSKA